MNDKNVFFYTLILLLTLFGAGLCTALKTALITLGKFQAKDLVHKRKSRLSLFSYILNYFFPKDEWGNLYFILSVTKSILLILYAIFAFIFLITLFPSAYQNIGSGYLSLNLLAIAGAIFGVYSLIDLILRIFASLWPRSMIPFTAPLCSFYLILFLPLSGLFLKISKYFHAKRHFEKPFGKIIFSKNKVMEMIKESDIGKLLEPYDQKIMASLVTFRHKVVREIMIPRVNIICLPAHCTIREAAKLFVEEDYSRIPVFRESVDNVIGLLMYKDVLKTFARVEDGDKKLLEAPIETILKPIIYAPENKKISQLFQEFRTKQTHLAIIVNEYGGTEGIVTIEDILEELVGEIEDEYDIEEERQFWELPSGSYVVDAKMSIIDIENKLDIKIPHDPEYETIGGYVFHRAGTIPSKGWKLHHDEFELEVLISNDRSIDKIRVTPLKFKSEDLPL